MKRTHIRSVTRRAFFLFPLAYLIVSAVVATTLYEGISSGEISRMKKPVWVLGERITQGLVATVQGPTDTPTPDTSRWRKELEQSPIPTKIPVKTTQRIYYIQPTISIRSGSTTTTVDTNAWWQQAQQQNAALSEQSKTQMEAFQKQSQQRMDEFRAQAQQGMTDFQAQSDANVQAFKEKYGF